MTGIQPMTEVQLFLAHAIQLERESAVRYEELHAAMTRNGHAEAAAFFGAMAVYSRRHLDEALEIGGFHDTPDLPAEAYRWFGGVSPEAPRAEDLRAELDLQSALLIALEGEHRSQVFYGQVSEHSGDEDVRRIAGEFAAEEAGHVAELQGWLKRSQDSARQ